MLQKIWKDIQKDTEEMNKDVMKMYRTERKIKTDTERSPELATFRGLALRSKMGLKQGPEGSER